MTSSMRMGAALAAAVAAALAASSAAADGARRAWRSDRGIGAISRNVITPWYVGYYPSHYSYYRPDPTPAPVYRLYAVAPACWAWSYWTPYPVC